MKRTHALRLPLQSPTLPLLACVAGPGAALPAPAEVERVIPVVAERFHYTPEEIEIRSGEAVLLEFSSRDFVHGFRIPALGLRADLPPGLVTRLHVRVAQAGRYPFLCDNFCGEGHEEMGGVLVVRAPSDDPVLLP